MLNQENNKFCVWVRCMTYNHAPYITDALDGFAMQQTNFPFICTIIDDDSTDGEQKIINKYLEDHFDLSDSSVVRFDDTDDYHLVFARHKTNFNCYFAVYFLKYNHYSIKKSKLPYLAEWADTKYIALCEGDDWWTNSGKLKMQVDFLETHPDYVLCFGDAKRLNTDNNKTRGSINQLSRRENKNETFSKKERFYRVLSGYYHIQTLTALYRSVAVKNRPMQKHQFMMGDTNLWLHLSQQGNFHYFEETLGVYNLHQVSATHSKASGARFKLSMYEMRCYYCEEYEYAIPNRIKKMYNRAFISIYMQKKEIIPTPIFQPFRRNSLQWVILNLLLKRGKVFQLYQHIIFPIRRHLLYLGTRANLAKRITLNLFT